MLTANFLRPVDDYFNITSICIDIVNYYLTIHGIEKKSFSTYSNTVCAQNVNDDLLL